MGAFQTADGDEEPATANEDGEAVTAKGDEEPVTANRNNTTTTHVSANRNRARDSLLQQAKRMLKRK